ncbi:MAG: hypothetical protein Kow0042_29010 [Calditrichia bacterium]
MDVKIKQSKNIEPIKIRELSNVEPLRIEEISKVSKIAPIAAHIKEVNLIDPITVEPLKINEVKHIDPIRVEKFNVTNLPMVNLSVRQLPAVDLNIRRLAPVSIGMHQNFQIPSNYTVRAQVLGIELFRVHLNGQTCVIPRERFRREQGRSANRSFPEPTVAGNPAIPSIKKEKTVHYTGCIPSPRNVRGRGPSGGGQPPPVHKMSAKSTVSGISSGFSRGAKSSPAQRVSFHQPVANFSISSLKHKTRSGSSSVSSGGK